MSTPLMFSLMVGFLIACLYLIHLGKAKEVVWGRPAAAICGFAAIGVAVFNALNQPERILPPNEEALLQWFACGTGVAKFVADKAPKQRQLLVLTHDGMPTARIQQFLAGLQSAHGTDFNHAAIDSIWYEDPEDEDDLMPTPARQVEILSATIKMYPKTDIVVSLLPIPFEEFSGELESGFEKAPQFVLIYPRHDKTKLLEHSEILGMIDGHPRPPVYDPNAPTIMEPDAVFDDHFIVVERSNLKTLKDQYPSAFDSNDYEDLEE